MSLLSFPIFPPCLTALFRSRSAILHSHETIYKYAKQKSGEKKTFIYHITDRSIAFYWHLICFSVFFSRSSTEIDFSVRYRIRHIRMLFRTSEVLTPFLSKHAVN